MDYMKLANEWRDIHAEQTPAIATSGIVLIWENQAYAWRDKIRDASTEKPGVIAVDTEGRTFKAEGGDDYNGAKCWVVIP